MYNNRTWSLHTGDLVTYPQHVATLLFTQLFLSVYALPSPQAGLCIGRVGTWTVTVGNEKMTDACTSDRAQSEYNSCTLMDNLLAAVILFPKSGPGATLLIHNSASSTELRPHSTTMTCKSPGPRRTSNTVNLHIAMAI